MHFLQFNPHCAQSCNVPKRGMFFASLLSPALAKKAFIREHIWVPLFINDNWNGMQPLFHLHCLCCNSPWNKISWDFAAYKLIPKGNLNKHCLSLIEVISWGFSFCCLHPAVAESLNLPSYEKESKSTLQFFFFEHLPACLSFIHYNDQRIADSHQYGREPWCCSCGNSTLPASLA